MSKHAFDAKIAALEALRAEPAPAPALAKGLKDRNNFIAAKAATLAGELTLSVLIPDLLAAFDRNLSGGAKVDPQCWAKNAIAKSLKDLGHPEAEPFLQGLRHVQWEPVWGGRVDTAVTLRSTCVLALVDTRLDDLSMLNHLVEALADAAMIVRVEAAVALSRAGIPEAAALLRLKALSGDVEAEVTGQCLHSLLQMTPRDGVPFAARFLGQVHADDVRAEAASALAQSHEPTAIEALKSLWGTVLSAALRKALLPILASSPQRAAAEFLAGLGTEEARAALAESRFREEFG